MAAGIALGLGLFRRSWGLAAALAIPAVLAFHRDPPRRPKGPLTAQDVLAPGEGRILRIGPARDSLGEECLEVSTFLALWNVHVQRFPIDGVVISRKDRPGGFVPAFLARAGEANQSTTVRIERNAVTCEVVQVAGSLARRIVCWARDGDRVRAGQRLGMIKLGSQVVLRVPVGTRILVSERQRVRAGETIMAVLPAAAEAGARHP